MYWPDYNIRPRRKARWAPALVLGLVLGLVIFTLLEGWWRILLPGPKAGTERVAVSAASTLPTPIALTTLPRVAGSGSVAAAAEESRTTTATPPGAAVGPTTPGETVVLAEQAPDFTLPDLFEETTTFTLSDYRGRPVILNFWASWCVPCRREMPALEATAANYADEGLLLLGMNQTYIDDLAAARAFVEELALSFPNTRDDSGAVGSNAYQIVGIPTTVFIDRDGEVVHIQIGEMSLEQITTYTERLIAGERLQR